MDDSLITQAVTHLKNRYLLINLLTKRIKQLMDGAPSLVEPPGETHMETALREIIADKIWAENPEEEKKQATEEEGKLA